MKIGVLSDSHGKLRLVLAAGKTFVERGVEAVVHCGDIDSVECLEALAGAAPAVYAVPGNVDAHQVEALRRAAGEAGIIFADSALVIPLGDGERLAATHGHDAQLLHRLITSGEFAYVCCGHTHKARDEQIGPTRILNGGALARPKHPHYPAVLILDTSADTVELLPV